MNNKEEIFINLRNKKFDVIEKYIEKNLDLDYNIKDVAGTYLLSYIVTLNEIKILKKLLKTNIKIDIFDTDGKSILYIPIKFGYYEIIELLLDYGEKTIGIPIYTITDINGNTALHYAIMFQNTKAINLLLPLSNLNTADLQGNVALHHAVLSYSLEIVKLIYDNSIDVNANIRNNNGETAIFIACRLSLADIVEFLVSKKVDLNIPDNKVEGTPLHALCFFSNNEKILKILLDNNIDINAQDSMGQTVMHYCAKYDKYAFMSIIMTHPIQGSKVNVNIFSRVQDLPLHIILMMIPENIHLYLELLLEKTNVNFQNNLGITCLHSICQLALWKTYKDVLKKKKLDILIKNNKGERPIDFIDKSDYDDFINIVAESYVNILLLKNNSWGEAWENECSEKTREDCQKRAKTKILQLIDKTEPECNERSYPMKSSPGKCIKLELDEKVNFNTLSGTRLDTTCGLLYVTNKHKNSLSMIDVFDLNDPCEFATKNNSWLLDRLDCVMEKYTIEWYKNMLHIDKNFEKLFLKYLSFNVKFIIIFIAITAIPVGHANILLYSKDKNEIERFDPWGAGRDPELDIKLKNYFISLIPDIHYIDPNEYLPVVGFQQVDMGEQTNNFLGDPGGYCLAWSIWYTDMRIQYPDIDRKKLVKYIMTQLNEKQLHYRSIIRNYSKKITDIRDEVLSIAGTDVNIYHNLTLSQHEIRTPYK